MVVPVSLDPGYRDPRSPYYRETEADRERERKREAERKAEEARAEQAREQHRKKQIRSGFQLIFGGD
jgi:hypothetical protein